MYKESNFTRFMFYFYETALTSLQLMLTTFISLSVTAIIYPRIIDRTCMCMETYNPISPRDTGFSNEVCNVPWLVTATYIIGGIPTYFVIRNKTTFDVFSTVFFTYYVLLCM